MTCIKFNLDRDECAECPFLCGMEAGCLNTVESYVCLCNDLKLKDPVRGCSREPVYVPAENLTCTRGYRRDADRCLYIPAENLNCTRGYQRDVNRCYPCPPGHYDNGSQTHCLPCPGGTYMTSFAADACIPCPGDKITDEEGADNKDLCRSNGTKGF
ncbi:uncharacterized protein LOC143226275 isoform X1 [Tachypleus tridentatus]|uniref:uncharacterized protein LOC143226275 isoform X1 n=1 Tax=Tachypleus tridentatus TaxID=6853 RepID=UPI003FD4951B